MRARERVREGEGRKVRPITLMSMTIETDSQFQGEFRADVYVVGLFFNNSTFLRLSFEHKSMLDMFYDNPNTKFYN